MPNDLTASETIAQDTLVRYNSANAQERRAILEEIKNLPANTKALMFRSAEFRTFIDAFMVDVLLGITPATRSQLRALETVCNPNKKILNNINFNSSPERGSITVEDDPEMVE